jgi:hypothetical protein
MNCKCGFKFAEPGEFRNCEAFINEDGHGCVVCPECGLSYVCGQPKEQVEDNLKENP